MPIEGVLVGETRNGKFEQSVVAAGTASSPTSRCRSAARHRAGPYEYLLAGLGACTSMTMRLYAEHKQLPLERVSVLLKHDKIHAADCEECETQGGQDRPHRPRDTLEGELSAEQRAKLLEIADKCPVHRTLHGEINIRTKSRMSVVIVGAGQAAAQLVQSLRQGGYKDAIRMIGDEPYAPYQRPPLSKKFLTERPPAETLYFRPEKFWQDLGVTADYGTAVEAIDRADRRIGHKGGSADYGMLFLATGTRRARSAGARRQTGRRVLAAQDRRRAPPARSARCGKARGDRRRRLYRSRGRGGRARRGGESQCWRPRIA